MFLRETNSPIWLCLKRPAHNPTACRDRYPGNHPDWQKRHTPPRLSRHQSCQYPSNRHQRSPAQHDTRSSYRSHDHTDSTREVHPVARRNGGNTGSCRWPVWAECRYKADELPDRYPTTRRSNSCPIPGPDGSVRLDHSMPHPRHYTKSGQFGHDKEPYRISPDHLHSCLSLRWYPRQHSIWHVPRHNTFQSYPPEPPLPDCGLPPLN